MRNRQKRGISIATKWILVTTALISMVILMILASNTLLLRRYYIRRNEGLFSQEFALLQTEFVAPDRAFLNLLRERDRLTGFTFYVSDGISDRILLASMQNFAFDSLPEATEGNSARFRLPPEQSDFLSRNRNILEQGQEIYGQTYTEVENRAGFDLVFAARLDNRHLLLIVRPVEQLEDHISIANRFLLIIGAVTLVISIAAAWLTSRSIVRPIRDITEIAGHIANLDFSHAYTGTARDEVGILGNSINRISSQLDSAIKDLQMEMSLQKRFFAGVSHEFKTPVGLIRGYSESIKLGLAKSPEELTEFSGIIIDEADRLDHLVNDILVLVKSESTEFVLQPKDFDIAALLNRSIELNLPEIQERGILLSTLIPGEYVLYGDEGRIKQVFDNLLINALRHTPDSGRLIVTAGDRHGGFSASIENEGEIIPQGHLPHLFDPFYSVHESREKTLSGTGLGLSIVRNLVNRHGGRCGIENLYSTPFDGVKAWFWLPRRATE